MTTRIRDKIEDDVPSALEILARDAEAAERPVATSTVADGAQVIDMTDSHAILRERQMNGGRASIDPAVAALASGADTSAADAAGDATAVIDMTDAEAVLRERQMNGGRAEVSR